MQQPIQSLILEVKHFYAKKLQLFTLVMVTLSATAHSSSKNIVKSISEGITTLEIRMLENYHEVKATYHS
jgi:hypothetical protein